MQNSPTTATITNEYLSVLFINNTKNIQRHKSNVSGKYRKADENYGKTLYVGVKRLLNRIKRSINGGKKAGIGISWQSFKQTSKRKMKRKFGLVNYYLQLKTKKIPIPAKHRDRKLTVKIYPTTNEDRRKLLLLSHYPSASEATALLDPSTSNIPLYSRK